MNHQALYSLLGSVSTLVRLGDVVTRERVGHLDVTTVDAMPAESDLVDGLEVVDMVLVKVAVDAAKAEEHRAEFVEFANQLPADRMAGGPSYIEIGAELGDQGVAFQFMAVGQVLGLWRVVTGKTLGMNDAMAKELAGSGFVMINGYAPHRENEHG